MSDVKWPIEETSLVKCPNKKELLKCFNRDELELFERNVNMKIEETAKHVATPCLQYGGFVFGVLIMITACIVVTSDDDNVLGGILMFALGIVVLGGAFWYRDQLHQRKWKNVAQQLQMYFKEVSRRHPGLQLEFHIQGHHSKDIRQVKNKKSKGKKNKKSKGKKEERTVVWYERYIVISIPYDDYIPTKERAKDHDKSYRGYETEDVPSGGFVQNAPPTQQTVTSQGVVSLPYWWVRGKDEDNRVYYINNFKKKTQWKPPSADQIERERKEMSSVLAPPPYDSRTKSANRFQEVKRKSLSKRKSIIKERRASKRLNVKPENKHNNSNNKRNGRDANITIKDKSERKSRDNGQKSDNEGNRRSKRRNDDRSSRRKDSRGSSNRDSRRKDSSRRNNDRPRRSQPRSNDYRSNRNDADYY